MSALITTQVWQSLDSVSKIRLLTALRIRYEQGEKPTYKASGPIQVQMRVRRSEIWVSNSLLGGETFSPLSTFGEFLVLTPLGASMMANGVNQVKIPIAQAFDHIEGFAEHMLAISERLDGDMLEEMRERARAEESLRAEEARKQVEFTSSDGWGEF